MAYRVEIGPKADVQLSELDPAIGSAVDRKIMWLTENAGVMIHRRLVGMPDDHLAGLCKLRTGDWRILYWTAPKRIAVSDACQGPLSPEILVARNVLVRS